MKIKPIYIYGSVVVLAIIFLVFFTSNNDSNIPQNVQNNQMPSDSIHKGLQAPPGKDNVSSEVKHHIEMLKKAVEESPKDTLKMREYADFLSAAHQPDEAIPYYNKILSVNPNVVTFFFLLPIFISIRRILMKLRI